MGPRREDPSEAALRQRTESNNTLNQFLGGSTRRYSWLSGDVSAVTQRRPAIPPSTHSSPPRHKVAGVPRAASSRDVSSTSASPNLPNKTVPTPASRTTSSSISPPQTPSAASVHLPVGAPTPASLPQAQSPEYSPYTPDKTGKRKEMEGHAQSAPPSKRPSISGSVASPVNSPTQGVFPGAVALQNPHHGPLSTGPHVIMATTAQQQAIRHVSSPVSVQSGWQQAHAVSIPQQAVYPEPPTHNGQRARVLPGNGPPTGPKAPVNLYVNTVMQQPQPIPVSAVSPPLPSPGVQYPSPISQGGRSFSSPQALHMAQYMRMPTWHNEPVRQQTLPHPPLPVIEPYSRANCENAIMHYMDYRRRNGLPQLQGVETPRVELLSQAAGEEDSMFLFVHQMVSLCATGSDNIPSLLRNTPGFADSMSLLNNLLAGSQIKDAHLVDFFGKLPCALSNLAMERPDSYHTLVNYLMSLSHVLSTGWEHLKHACVRRGYPPLATDLWLLNVCSPTLMDVFFLASLRQIWAISEQTGQYTHEKAKQLFHENKRDVYAAAASGQLSQEAIHHLAVSYHQRFAIFAQQTEHRRTRRANMGSSLPSSPAVPTFPANHTNGQTPISQPPTPQHPYGYQQPQANNQAYPQHAAGYGPVNPISQPVQQSALLFPAAGAPRPDQVATATWQVSALHQAHIRDPRFSDDVSTNPEPQLLYQFVHGFAASPSRLGNGVYQTTAFIIPEGERIAQTAHTDDGQRRLRHMGEGSKQYRLRFVKVGKAPAGPEDLVTDWTLKATSWPHNFYYKFNGHMLEVRRKQHHTKDLPIDITEFVQPNGADNVLEIYMNVAANDPALSQYAYAIEIVDAHSHNTILDRCSQNVISSQDSLEAITGSLNRRASADDDDDIIIDDAKTNITIYDPISQGRICEMPARGRDCKHRECFDLLTFLQSRPRENPGWPSDADSWKCPICLADVRPQYIVIDGFLKEVRDKLVYEGREKARAIIVESDGSWLPKLEDDVSSERSTPDPAEASPPVGSSDYTANNPALRGALAGVNTGLPKTGSGMTIPKKRVVVIDLLD